MVKLSECKFGDRLGETLKDSGETFVNVAEIGRAHV